MTPERHEQVSHAFLQARALDGKAQRDFLSALAEEDPDLCDQVGRLLRSDEPDGAAAIDRPLFEPALNAAGSEPTVELGEVRSAWAVYRPVRILGEGGASTVYLANQTAPVRRTVALKILRRPAGRREAIARFEAERQAVALMNHPGIAALYDAGLTADGRPFFVMEPVEGEPITDWVRRAAPSPHETLRLFLSLCGAVVHAHQKGVVHRDLKPANILVARGGGAAVKVIDFGVAKSLGSARLHERSFATAHGQLVGTLAYMSPEQLAGDARQIDIRTDVYALGAVLQEMLTGRPAIDVEGLDLPEAIRRVEACRRAPLRAGGRALPQDLDLIIAKAMAPEPARRYTGVPELAADVERFLGSRPVLARRPGALYTARKFAGRHRATCAGLAAVAVALAGAGVWIAAAHRRAERLARATHETAMFLLTDVANPLRDQIGSRPVRRSVLLRLLEQTEAILRQEPEDPGIQEARAAVLSALADIEEQENNLAAARVHVEDALRIHRVLAERFPDAAVRLSDLSIALVRVGDMFKDEHWRGALPYYDEALAIDERLAREHPGNPTHLSNLAWSYERVGVRAMWAGDLDGARRLFELQRATISDPAARHPGTSDVERCMVAVEIRFSQLSTDPAESLAHAVEARRWAQLGVVAEPGGRTAALALMSAGLHVAGMLRDRGRCAEALEALTEAAGAAEAIARADARDAEALAGFRAAGEQARELCRLLDDPAGEAAWRARLERITAEIAPSTPVSVR